MVKTAAVDVLSVFGGFILGAGTMARSARAHLHPEVAAAVVCGVAVASLLEYAGLRLIGEPYAGATSSALLITLPIVVGVGGLAASAAVLVGGASPVTTITAPSAAAVLALTTPAVTRGWVQAFCRHEAPALRVAPNPLAAATEGAGPDVLPLEDRRQEHTVG